MTQMNDENVFTSIATYMPASKVLTENQYHTSIASCIDTMNTEIETLRKEMQYYERLRRRRNWVGKSTTCRKR